MPTRRNPWPCWLQKPRPADISIYLYTEFLDLQPGMTLQSAAVRRKPNAFNLVYQLRLVHDAEMFERVTWLWRAVRWLIEFKSWLKVFRKNAFLKLSLWFEFSLIELIQLDHLPLPLVSGMARCCSVPAGIFSGSWRSQGGFPPVEGGRTYDFDISCPTCWATGFYWFWSWLWSVSGFDNHGLFFPKIYQFFNNRKLISNTHFCRSSCQSHFQTFEAMDDAQVHVTWTTRCWFVQWKLQRCERAVGSLVSWVSKHWACFATLHQTPGHWLWADDQQDEETIFYEGNGVSILFTSMLVRIIPQSVVFRNSSVSNTKILFHTSGCAPLRTQEYLHRICALWLAVLGAMKAKLPDEFFAREEPGLKQS